MTNVLKSLVFGLVVCSLCFTVTATAEEVKNEEPADWKRTWVLMAGPDGYARFGFQIRDEDNPGGYVEMVPLHIQRHRDGRDEVRVIEVRDGFDLHVIRGKLLVGGREMRVPDYVFNPDHKVESIEQHAEFMWKNKHLPAVPGQKDVEKEGAVDVVGTSLGTLEELEKAHIYIEQLHQRLEKIELALAKKKPPKKGPKGGKGDKEDDDDDDDDENPED